MDPPKSEMLGVFLDKIVSDIFDSSTSSDASTESTEDDDLHEINPADAQNEHTASEFQKDARIIKFKGKHGKFSNIDGIILMYNQEDFKQYFKISQGTCEFILGLTKYDLVRKCHGNQPLPPQLQLLIALRKMASLDSYNQLCEKFGVGKASATRAVECVIRALSSRSSKFISWPKGDRIREVCQGFQTLSGFPKVVGALDSSRILIPAQPPDTGQEGNNTQYTEYSVQLQVVVDHEGRFTHVAVGSFGTTDKQEVFNNSILKMFVSTPAATERFPDDCHLVATSEYDLHEHVMVPYSSSNVSAEQETFNEHLRVTHSLVTKALSALKSHFASLRFKLEMSRLDLVPLYLTACCVLHNISLDRNDLFDNPLDISAPELNCTVPQTVSVASPLAVQKRYQICKQLHLSKAGVCFV